MPKMKPEQYKAQEDTVLALAGREQRVTINEIIESLKNGEKNISRPRAEKLVKKLNLVVTKRDGRTQFFGLPGSTPAPAPTPKATTSKRGTSVEARMTKLVARAEKLSKENEKLLSEIATLRAEVTAASVISVETAPAPETPAPAPEAATAEAPAAAAN